MNKKCEFEVIIVEANFLKDADFIGKQDPFITLMHQGKEMSTSIKEDGGKHAKWNEKLVLKNI